jgi:iron-sulfur cluster repair protein YtfE (RIC family)
MTSLSDGNFDLETRAGLPDQLRILAKTYPRTLWRAHPNFSDLTGFWLSRHGMFRDLIMRLQSQSQQFLDSTHPRFGAELGHYTNFFLNQLQGHHSIEDTHYFPKFAALDTRLEAGFTLLDSDHHALDGHINALANNTNTVLQTLSAGHDARKSTDMLLQNQLQFAAFLERHLSDEEDLIVPLILEYGPDMD